MSLICGCHLSLHSGGEDYNEVLLKLTTVEFEFEKRKRSVEYDEQQCITIYILSDILVEDTEYFEVILHSDDPLVMLDSDSAIIYILDNDRES